MKKILSLVLAIVMIASMAAVIVIPTSADEPSSTTYASPYTGVADTSWYEEDPDKTEYTLTTAAQLAGLSELVGNEWIQFKGVTIKLGADIVWNTGVFSIDADGKPLYDADGDGPEEAKPAVAGDNVFEYVPIGDRQLCRGSGDTTVHKDKTKTDAQFYGNFDGQGHTISGLFYDHPDESYMGLFSIFCGKELKNTSIINSYFGCSAFSGAFVGFAVIGESSGDDQTNVSLKFENLYSDAYIIINTASGNSRSGGLVGMIRPFIDDAFGEDTNPATNGFLVQFNKCWFDGHIQGINTTRYIGGILGFVAADDDTANRLNGKEDNGKSNVTEFNDCLVTGTINGVPEPASGNPKEEARVGLVLGAIFRGAAKFNNVVAALRDTNINADTVVSGFDSMGLPFSHKFMSPTYESEVKDEEGNPTGEKETKDRRGKGIVGFFESLPVDITYNNVFFVPIGYFQQNLPGQYVAADQGVKESQTETGEAVADSGLTLALVALGTSENFALTDVNGTIVPTLKNIKTTVDAVDPSIEIPNPSDIAETTTTEIQASVKPGKTDTPSNTTKPADNTTKPAVTEAPDDGGCGGFTAIGAVLALIALTGAAVVIKKK